MKKLLVLFLSFLLICFGLVATALAGDLDVDLACPTSVSYGTGTTIFYATVYLKNRDCTNSVTVQRYVTGLVANAGNMIGNVGIYGPFPKALAAAKIVPHANCTTCTNPKGCPGTVPAFSVPVATVPNTTGKIAMGLVDFITNSGQSIAGDMCMVSIVP